MTAEERGMQMMSIPMKDLPPLAYKFMRKMASEIGMCMEVCLTAYCCYAQAVEGLPCTDDLYIIRLEDKNWFTRQLTLNGEKE